jgi:hypothetical protein
VIEHFLPEAYPPVVIGWTAIVTGMAGLAALILAILFFALGPPFGDCSDTLAGLTAILSAGLAMLLFPQLRGQSPQLASAGLALAILGGFIAAFGSVLTVTRAANWFVAHQYIAAGDALLGLWLIILNRSVGAVDAFPNGVVTVGIFAGTVMALGLAAIPGIMAGAESEKTAPWISRYIGTAGNLGALFLYPVWGIWLGRAILRI